MASIIPNLLDLFFKESPESLRQKLVQSLKAGENLSTITLLIDKGADIFAIDERGRTALHHAAAGGNLDTLSYLIDIHKFDIHAQTEKHNIPLHFAVWKGRIQAADDLVQRSLLEGVSVEALGKEDSAIPLPIPGGSMMLFDAVGGGHLEMVDHLVSRYHLDPHIQDQHGNMLLYNAVRFNRSEMRRHLIARYGLDPQILNGEKETLLHCAAYYGRLKAFRELVAEYNLDIQARDVYGCTPLHKAAEKGHVKMMRYLLSPEHGLDVNVRDKAGNTPLHEAVFSDKFDAIECLLELGADINARNVWGHTIFSIVPANSKLTSYLAEKMQTLAEEGNVEIQFKLGEVRFFNNVNSNMAYADIADPDRKKTYGYIICAAEQDHAMANCYRGMLYEFGLFGMQMSFKQASVFYEKAYQKILDRPEKELESAGYVSLINLFRGVHCLMGTLKIPEPHLTAAFVFAKAARVEKIIDTVAQERLKDGDPSFANMEKEFRKKICLFLKDRAERGKFSALLLLAMMQAGGLFGTKKGSIFIDTCRDSLTRAKSEKSALPFDAATLCVNIANMYENGLWLPQDREKAAAWRNLYPKKAEEIERSSGQFTINEIAADSSRVSSPNVFPNGYALLGGGGSSSSSAASSHSSQPRTEKRKGAARN